MRSLILLVRLLNVRLTYMPINCCADGFGRYEAEERS